MKVVGFTGGMGVGKSTAIQFMKDNTNRIVKLVKFAQPIYDIQEFAYRRIQPVYARPETFVKDRKLLQWLGTEWGRSLKDSIWVDIWKADVLEWKHDCGEVVTIVCDDVRFDNEAQAIKDMGGTIIKINAADVKDRIDTSAGIVHHQSESGIDSKFIDIEVDNSGTMLQFFHGLGTVYKQLGLIPNKGVE
jgi:hypothetical protein